MTAMFTHTHYVPILRWKRAEQRALRDLYQNLKPGMTPLIEIPDERYLNPSGLNNCAVSIAGAWGNAPFFFDFGLISEKLSPISSRSFFDKARNLGLSIIPTTGLTQNQDYQSAIRDTAKKDGRGICIRLFRDELEKQELFSLLEVLLEFLAQSENTVDLVIDLKIFQSKDSPLGDILSTVPHLAKWRTVTIAMGAFPQNLTGFSVGEHELFRSEWFAWLNSVRNHALARIPTFGDYTIIHPYLTVPIPGMNISASIRYTAPEYWVIMRGEGLRNKDGHGYAQYPANAQLLTRRPEYCGPWFSIGDRYISEIALKEGRTGSPETWLRAGINHHLTFVIEQLANLFGKARVLKL